MPRAIQSGNTGNGMTPPNEMFILVIRFDDQTSYELKEILNVLGSDVIVKLIWGVESLDWLGSEDASRFNQEVDAASGRRLLVRGDRLLDLSRQVWQVIEGRLVGHGTEDDAREFLEKGAQLSQFGTSTAEIAVEVKDGSIFEVYLRSQAYADQLLKHFPNARWYDPTETTVE